MLVILYKEIQADTYGAFQLVTLIDLVAIPAILYITENISGVKKVIENKIFVFLGKISMEIYYIHWLIMTVLTWWIKEGNVNTKEYLGLLLITIGIAAVVKKQLINILRYTKLKVNKQYNKARQFFYVLLFNYKSAILPIVHEKGEIKVHEQTRT